MQLIHSMGLPVPFLSHLFSYLFSYLFSQQAPIIIRKEGERRKNLSPSVILPKSERGRWPISNSSLLSKEKGQKDNGGAGGGGGTLLCDELWTKENYPVCNALLGFETSIASQPNRYFWSWKYKCWVRNVFQGESPFERGDEDLSG